MPILLLIGLRLLVPTVFYVVAVLFILFLIVTAIIGICNKEYGMEEGATAGIYLLITILLLSS